MIDLEKHKSSTFTGRAADFMIVDDLKDTSALVTMSDKDMVNHPPHYTSHPSGVECIQVTEHMGFCVGNVVKYLWRADEKHDDGGIEDLKKALWYVQGEISKREAEGKQS